MIAFATATIKGRSATSTRALSWCEEISLTLSDSSGWDCDGTSVHRALAPNCCAKSTGAGAIALQARRALKESRSHEVQGGSGYGRCRSRADVENQERRLRESRASDPAALLGASGQSVAGKMNSPVDL